MLYCMNETTHRALPPVSAHSLHAAGLSWKEANERYARYTWGILGDLNSTVLYEQTRILGAQNPAEIAD